MEPARIFIKNEMLPWKAEIDFVKTFSKNLLTSQDNAQMSAHYLRVEPGGEITVHAHARETELHFIAQGRGQASLGDERHAVEGGDAVLALPTVPHGIRNTGGQDLVVLCIFAPPLV